MSDYDPANTGSWNNEQGFGEADGNKQERLQSSTEQEVEANYSLEQSTHAPGDFPPAAGTTDDVGDYDPATVTEAHSLAPNSLTQAPLKPSPQPVAKKPRTVGGFLVGESDSEEEAESAQAKDVPKPNGKPAASLPPSPLRASVNTNQVGGSSSNTSPKVKPPPTPALGGSGNNSSQAGAAFHQEVPKDRVQLLEDRVNNDARGAVDEWLALISEHRARNDVVQARQVYERFLKTFPEAADIWKAYLEMEIDMGNFPEAEAIFGRCLLAAPTVPLLTVYLNYIRRRHLVNEGADQRQIVAEAYKFVLGIIGLDKEASKIWSDFIQFLKSVPGKVGGSEWQDQQKMDQLRKAFQQATSVPIDNVNMLWKEYDQFEMNLNKITGRKYLAERSPSYMSAKSAVTALRNITQGLQRTTLPRLPPAAGFDGFEEYMDQVEKWKRWIEWEKSDPLELKDDQPESFQKRVRYVYNQALMALRFWPNIWADAAQWCFDKGIVENDRSVGVEYLIRGIEANPESVLLAFKHGEYIEATFPTQETDEGKMAKGQAVREPYENNLNTLYGLAKAIKERQAIAIARLEDSAAADIAAIEEKGAQEDDDDDYLVNSEKEAREKHKKDQIAALQQGNAVQLELLTRTISFVWIALMRAMRRVQGKGEPKGSVGGMRRIFQEARQRGRLSSEVYVASAQMEWMIYKEKVGGKIFERGAKLFPEDENFTLEYIKYLHSTDDFTNARVLFETFVNRLTQHAEKTHKTKCLYAYFHKFESQYGDLAQITKLEQRMAELFPEDPKLSLFNSRFSTDKFDPIAARMIVSPIAQLKPKSLVPSIEANVSLPSSPRPTQIPVPTSPRLGMLQAVNSPKRPLAFDDFDEGNPPRKILRGEDFQRGASPLKGAAGRRLDQQRRMQGHSGASYQATPSPMSRDITFLMALTPRADTYRSATFDATRLVRTLVDTDVPADGSGMRGGVAALHMRQSSNDYGGHLRASPNPRPPSPYGGPRPAVPMYHASSLRPGSSGSYEPPPPVYQGAPPSVPQYGAPPPPPPPGHFDSNAWQQYGSAPPPQPRTYTAPPGYPTMPPYQGYQQY